ncbi:MAG TPA: S8 family serine peptidase [Gaiellaceae bacterium]|nr:S8 family serine peptidase [Gaiellaceae bacterium]
MSKRTHLRRRRGTALLAALLLVGVLSVAAAGVASGSASKLSAVQGQVRQVSTYAVGKSASGYAAKTDQSLLGKTDSKLVNVVIKYAFTPTASYAGKIRGLKATSPRVTHKSLRKNARAVKAYQAFAAKRIHSINAAVKQAVPAIKLGQSFRMAYGGVAARVPANKVEALLGVKGVVAVQKDTLNQPLDDNTSFIGATNVWPSLGGSTHAGNNVVIGVIDTGVWPEHPMLSPAGVPAPAGGIKGCQFGDGTDVAHLGPTFACNNKLVGAYAKTATYMAAIGSNGQEFCNNTTGQCSARDSEGHGTHTTTTAGGDCVASAVLYGVERGPVCGIAPGAHIEQFRVCLAQGCFGSDSVSAVAQAIADGVNVINFSISGGGSPYTDPVELAFLDATNAGISVNAAAGNAGPGAATSDHGGPWTTTVGASTGPRAFGSTLHLTADGGAILDVPGVTLTNGIGSATPVVMAATLPKAGGGLEDALCQSDLAAGAASGKVVVCNRGNNGRIDKGRRVLQGGAAGMILTNQSAAVTDLESDNHYLPAIQTQWNSGSIQTFVTTHTNVMATWPQGAAQAAQADVMASFSSRGPTGDWIKPDVTAPGVQVLAGTTPQPDQTTADNGPPGNLYMAIAGTSMSSPHAAGVSALVKAAHPSWTPEEIKSALMTSSVQTVVKEDGVTPAGVFDMGGGSIRADRAVNPTLVFNETYADFVAAGSDTVHRVDLNLPSIDATTFGGSLTTHRTAFNVSGKKQNLAVQITQPAGVTITVGNKNHDLHIAPGSSLTFPITISAPDVANGQYQARINLVPQKGGNTVTMPVAFVKKQGSTTLTNSCSPLSFAAKTGVSHCTVTAQNLAASPATASINVTTREQGKALRYKNIGAPGSVIDGGDGVQWSGTLTAASAPPVNAINNITGSGPAGGYLPLYLFGGNLVIPGGDDALTNVNVPSFNYGGEAYTRIGVVTNGYVVVGGGDASDVNFFPQTFPNPGRPNNVMAPFWTDLNTTGGTGGTPAGTPGNNVILVNTLTDGAGHSWIVVDFEKVRNFSNATTHTGEIWIQYQGGEQLTWSYETANAASGDPGSAINWGAENRDGSSGKNLAAPPADNTEYRPVLGPPIPGGSVSIPFDVWGKKVGTWHSDATLLSSLVPGATIASQSLTITP